MKLSSFSIIIIFSALILVGISLVPSLNIQHLPSHSLPRLSVNYSWHNASAKVIEQEVTSKLEGVFNSMRGIKNINSGSNKGSGYISLEFKKSVNLDAIRFEVATLIRQTYPLLPKGVSSPSISMSAGGSNLPTLMTYTINASSSSQFIENYAKDNIAPKLSVIEGVNQIAVYGATPYEWEVKFATDKIAILGISGNDISTAIKNYFRKEIIGLAEITKNIVDKSIVSLVLKSNFTSKLKWNKVPIKKLNNRIIYLTDIAVVKNKEKQPTSYYRINGLNSINMVVYSEKSVNTIKLAQTIKDVMSGIKQTLPRGYSITLAYDSTQYISKDLRRIAIRTIFSVIILLLFVLIISRQYRYLLLITISLVANISIAIIFYHLFNLEIHIYSLAGITISFGFIIDSSIVMIDHIRFHHNKKVFLAILAATLTTIGSLSVIFFLDEAQRINLTDFAAFIIVNLSVSMAIALLLIPALMQKIVLHKSKGKYIFKRRRRVYKLSQFYTNSIVFSKRYKWLYIIVLVLGFGLPVNWLPEKIEDESVLANVYNTTLGSSLYQNDIRPWAEKILGGSLRLFTEFVFETSFYSNPSQTKLHVRGTMPEGCTIDQINDATKLMENYISKFDEVQMFQTRISDYRNSSITITFKPEYESSGLPFMLKAKLVFKAINLGGLDWSIYGVGKGFNNSMHSSNFGNNIIELEGYHYDKLYRYAEILKKNLMEHHRVRDVNIAGRRSWNSKPLHEYFIDFNKEKFGVKDLSLSKFHSFLKDQTYRRNLPPVFNNGINQLISLVSDKAEKFNVWDLKNNPILYNDRSVKLLSLATIQRKKSGNNIYKTNQQYQLTVGFDFLGSYSLAKKVSDINCKKLAEMLPIGFKVKEYRWGGWNKKDKNQYYLLFLIVLIIYFICSIALESLIQPLVIISMIPISFIGVFLTFYIFDFNFDQGGYASFILLCGIVVNASLYIINDYNNFCKKYSTPNNFKIYIKAFNNKIIPIFITIISTVLGLIPFVWAGQNEVFWFSFAVGSMGGLIFSFFAIIVYMPLFMSLNVKGNSNNYFSDK